MRELFLPVRYALYLYAESDGETLVVPYLDGETWTDETGDSLVTMGPGEANWYEDDFYINSMGQGIMVKTLE